MNNNEIMKIVFPYSKKDILDDFLQLRNTKKLKPSQKLGNKFVNYFTLKERLHTISSKGFSLFELIKDFDNLSKKRWLINQINKFYPDFNDLSYEEKIRALDHIYSFAGKKPSIFKPVVAKNFLLYCQKKYGKMNSVLDFTMGWGGRLVGCSSLDIPYYIGVDSNTNLREPYRRMVKELSKQSTTEITLFFTDALKVDYTKLKYDMVFTSPPYYNIEIYRKGRSKTSKLSKEEWNDFYRKIITTTYCNLQKGGIYCLNIPIYIYDEVVVPLLGKCDNKQSLHINHNNADKVISGNYKEYIYIWEK